MRRHAVVPSLLALAAALPGAEGDPLPAASAPAPLVVSATRLEGDAFLQPYAIHSYERSELDEANTRTALDALDGTPGVRLQRTAANQASPYIRGLTGEQTLLLFDGVRYNNALFRSGPNQYAAMIPDEAIGRIDVILGSGSTVMGSDGLTGSMDLRLAEAGRDAQRPVSTWARTRASSAEGGAFAGGVDGRAGGWAYSVDGAYAEYHDLAGGDRAADNLYGVATDTIPNSHYSQSSYGGRVAYEGFSGQRSELAAGSVRQYDAPRADGYYANSGVGTALSSRYFDPEIFDYAHLRHAVVDCGPFARIQATAWYHHHDVTEIREDRQGGSAPAYYYRRREWQDQVTTLGGDLQFGHRLGQHGITWGGTLYEDRTESDYGMWRTAAGNTTPSSAYLAQTGSSNPELTTIPDGSRYRGVGVFLQDAWQFAKRWEFLLGGRYDRVDWYAPVTAARSGFAGLNGAALDDGADAFTGQGRLAWNVVEPVVIFTGLSQGFRAPTLVDLSGTVGTTSNANNGTIQINGNPDLKPERSLTFELGSKFEHGADSASLTLFRTQLHDLIQTAYQDTNHDGVPDQASKTNTDSGLLHGVEVGHDLGLPFALPAGQRLALIQSVSYVHGEVDVPNADLTTHREYLSRANQFFGVAGLRYEPAPHRHVLVQTRWAAAYDQVAPGDRNDVRHTSAGYPDGGMPGWAVLDLKAGMSAPDGSWALNAAIENLFDKTYREVGSGTDGAGTNLVVSGQVRF